jgi:hypothetical protein
MAPERVHSIIALDLTITDGVLHGAGERIEMAGEPIFVTWYTADPLEGNVSILPIPPCPAFPIRSDIFRLTDVNLRTWLP